MNYQAKAINILGELIRYFTFHHITDLAIRFTCTKKHLQISVSGKTDNMPDDAPALQGILSSPRKPEFEEYYWGLLGSSSSRNELSVLGCLVDDGKVAYKDGVLQVTVERSE